VRLPFFVAIGSIVLATFSIKGTSRERFEMKFHSSRLAHWD
jgi:hypothetical protein